MVLAALSAVESSSLHVSAAQSGNFVALTTAADAVAPTTHTVREEQGKRDTDTCYIYKEPL
jgi:hypothetical protein